ncbi:uncharacterized protein LOC103505668 [Diaphorina citri]|uniref:Uncharacterized protein LOC103505668 n=1 Tax=Diaphorina citri TaxID=121845 RepID=A0A1S3CUT0_DIACI|nr:uncharacterized protein LOC103505668 [Diaphorina citri]
MWKLFEFSAPPITVPQSSPSHLVFTQSPPPPTPAASLINLNMSGDTSIYHSNSFQPAPVYQPEASHTISNGAGGAPPMLLPVHFVSPPPSQVPAFNNNQTPIMSYGPHQPMQFQTMQPIVTLPPVKDYYYYNADIAVNKCEGACNSQVQPSVITPNGFLKECYCCRESYLRERVITLTHCYDPDGMRLTSEKMATLDIKLKEPADCKCYKCGDYSR